jgi:hypothetical protein
MAFRCLSSASTTAVSAWPSGPRACLQTSQTSAAAKWRSARKLRVSLSKRMAIAFSVEVAVEPLVPSQFMRGVLRQHPRAVLRREQRHVRRGGVGAVASEPAHFHTPGLKPRAREELAPKPAGAGSLAPRANHDSCGCTVALPRRTSRVRAHAIRDCRRKVSRARFGAPAIAREGDRAGGSRYDDGGDDSAIAREGAAVAIDGSIARGQDAALVERRSRRRRTEDGT